MSKKPVVVLTWVGTEPTLPAILLNNHMDKVPLFETNWSDNPFGGEIDDQKTYARTSPHKKTASIQCLEAVRRLKNSGVTLKRTINLCFAPDGFEGMLRFLRTEEFDKLNIGFALDSGLPNEFTVFNGERCVWKIRVHCQGIAAGDKMTRVLDKFYAFKMRIIERSS
ncbi:aminoacylase-1-like [Zophobas morio]|uniref:aminoacylase-1-like n=1 Tax=Zophobas morio TaxID=2755281 RepID=UPI00308285BE